VGPWWRNRESTPSVGVLADKVVVVEEVQSGRSPSAAACAVGVPLANTVRSMATPSRACVLDGRRARAGLERAGMPRRMMAAPVMSVPRRASRPPALANPRQRNADARAVDIDAGD
jgi:hypothetical protein